MELVYIVLIIVAVMYFNKVIKAVTSTVEEAVMSGSRMSSMELQAVEADQIVRHAETDVKRAERVNKLTTAKKTRLSATDILKMKSENKL